MLPLLRSRSCFERRNHDFVIENPDCPSASYTAVGSAVRTASIERGNKISGCVVLLVRERFNKGSLSSLAIAI
jgi:hypothetical protein